MNGPVSLPLDGCPLSPSPSLAAWREESSARRMTFSDGHIGWLVTDYHLGRKVLENPAFSQVPMRFPGPTEDFPDETLWDVDEQSRLAKVADILGTDGATHQRLRRTIAPKFSVRSARAHEPAIAKIVANQIGHLQAHGSPANLHEEFSEPISAAVHCHILGIPAHMTEEFSELFVGPGDPARRVGLIRRVIEHHQQHPGEGVVSELLASELTAAEVEGLVGALFSSGRDSVAYMISTAMVALLTHPKQLSLLRANPHLLPGAIEEFMRFGTMFLTLFPRTATEDVELDGYIFKKGESVSVSPVASNRNPDIYANPDVLDIERDARGHLGFGHGIHGCVGQQVARVEIRLALEQLLENFPELSLVSAEQLEPRPFPHPVAIYGAGAVVVSWP